MPRPKPLKPRPEPCPPGGLSAKGKVLDYLSRRAYTEAELTQKLKRSGYGAEEGAEALAWARHRGFLSDKVAAESTVRAYTTPPGRAGSRTRGRAWLKQKLWSRGVPKELAEEAVAERSDEDELVLAQAVAIAMLNQLSGLPKDVQKRRLYARLLRRGFAPSVVAQVCSSVLT